ncbi:MAG: hypothetical protein R6U25_07050 [Alkalispirochaeta sp.]
MNYGTNWLIQELLGRVQHAELVEARMGGLQQRLDDIESTPPRKQRRTTSVRSIRMSRDPSSEWSESTTDFITSRG